LVPVKVELTFGCPDGDRDALTPADGVGLGVGSGVVDADTLPPGCDVFAALPHPASAPAISRLNATLA
jgi:hypothetical protein